MKRILFISGFLFLIVILIVTLLVKFLIPKVNILIQMNDAESFSEQLDKKSVSADGVMLDEPMSSQGLVSLSKADLYINQGAKYISKGYYHAAIFCYNRSIEIKPNNVSAYINRGKSYDIMNKLDEAILDFNRVIEIDPYHIEAYGRRGFVYIKKGNLEQAIADCNKAIEIDLKDSREIFVARIKGESFNDRFKINRVSDKIKENQSRAYFYRGTAYEYKGDLRQALSDYNKAIEIESSFFQYTYYYSRAKLYLQMQKYDKSWEDVHKAEFLGYKAEPYFLKKLKKASRRKN